MRKTASKNRERRRTTAAWAATGRLGALCVAGALLLTGCGDMDPSDMDELFDKAREGIDQVQEAADDLEDFMENGADDTNPDMAARDREDVEKAREEWGTAVAPPALPEISDTQYNFEEEPGGDLVATEYRTYSEGDEEDLERHYTEEYGLEPRRDDGESVWSDESSTVRMRFDGADEIVVAHYFHAP